MLSHFRNYFHVNFINIFILGMACGIPLSLNLSTLSTWMLEVGIDKTTIGLFSIFTIPYSIKFLWAPIIDSYKLPWLYNLLGRRKSWLILFQILLAITIFILSNIDPTEHINLFAFTCFLLSFNSASQDIIVDAYRLELLTPEKQPLGLSSYILGYRIGMLVSGGFTLYLAEFIDWGYVYQVTGIIILVIAFYSLTIKEPRILIKEDKIYNTSYLIKISKNFIEPLKDFMLKKSWGWILLFATTYKLGEAFISHMFNPFLIEIGFAKSEMATIVKTYGLVATLFGTALGGSLVNKLGIVKSIYYFGVIQALTNIFYIIQEYLGYNLVGLTVLVTVENISGALASTAFLSYLGNLCTNKQYTATQYSIVSSLTSLGRVLISASSGFIVDFYGWSIFFLLCTIIAFIPLLVFKQIKKTF